MELTDFEGRLKGCRLAITGEGRLDNQTARGKVVAGVARKSQLAGVPVIALIGGLDTGAEQQLHALGLTAAISIVNGPITLEEAMRDAGFLLSAAAERVIRMVMIN